jgi:hypothetical protein
MVALILSAVPASASDATPAAQPAPTAQPAAATISEGDKLECRLMGAKTGSRLGGRRECRTKREWADIQHQDERELERMQTRDPMVRH